VLYKLSFERDVVSGKEAFMEEYCWHRGCIKFVLNINNGETKIKTMRGMM